LLVELSECFDPKELLMKQNLIDKYFPNHLPRASRKKSEAVDKVA